MAGLQKNPCKKDLVWATEWIGIISMQQCRRYFYGHFFSINTFIAGWNLPTNATLNKKTKQKKGIERLSVGLADGLQTFWWSLNAVCNKSHRCLRACWWLDSNVITERRWGSHFSSHFNLFYMLRCSSIYRDKQEKTELAWITVQPQQRPAPSCFWLVGTPYIYPKLCSGPNRKQLGGSLLISVVKKKMLLVIIIISIVKTSSGTSSLLDLPHGRRWSKRAEPPPGRAVWSHTCDSCPFVVTQRAEFRWNVEQQKKWRMEQLTDGMEY